MSLTGYPKVYALGHRELEGLTDGPVVVQEKYDGSQFSFGIAGGRLCVRSRGAEMDLDTPDKLFAPACETVKRIAAEALLVPGWTYRCETLAKPKHNALKYNRVPEGNLVLFDIRTHDGYLGPEIVQATARDMRIEPCSLLGIYNLAPYVTKSLLDLVTPLLQAESSLGGAKLEGVVIKNYYGYSTHKLLVGKLVSEEFKEKQHSRKPPKQARNMAAEIGETYRTEARWRKAVQHLRERSMLRGEPEDIGMLLKELHTDLLEEAGDEIREALFSHYWRDIARIVSQGFANWYKLELAKEGTSAEARPNEGN